jgi:hypothetical protein
MFAVAFSAFLGVLGYVTYSRFLGPCFWPPRIECDDPVRDFGTISDTAALPCEFVLRNTGARPLVVRDVKSGCGGCVTVLGFPESPIPPGATGLVRVALVPTSLEGKVRKSVAVFSSDPNRGVLRLEVWANVARRSGGDLPKSVSPVQ